MKLIFFSSFQDKRFSILFTFFCALNCCASKRFSLDCHKCRSTFRLLRCVFSPVAYISFVSTGCERIINWLIITNMDLYFHWLHATTTSFSFSVCECFVCWKCGQVKDDDNNNSKAQLLQLTMYQLSWIQWKRIEK